MSTLNRKSTDEWEALLGIRLLPPVLRYNPDRDRPELPSHTAGWLDISMITTAHHNTKLALGTGWPDRWTVTHRHGGIDQAEPVRNIDPCDLLGAEPIRNATWHRHSTARAGLHYMSSTGRLHPHESLFERDLLVALDFDGGVNDIASQPFTLTWHEDGGKPVRHTPDFMVVLGGEVWIINVRPAARMNLRLLRNAAALRAICHLHGWQEAVVTGYSRPPHTVISTIAAARQTDDPYGHTGDMLDFLATSGPTRFGDLVEMTGLPVVARAVLQRMIWDRDVTMDLNRGLTDETMITFLGVAA